MTGRWERPSSVLALSGGVGGARLVDGLARVLGPEALTVVVNTGDDFRHYGLYIAPDIDTVLYTLAGLANPATGWGRARDTDRVMAALRDLGDEAWFHLGDQDLATHLVRTAGLAAGATATAVTADLARSLGLRATVLPATDDPLETRIQTAAGELAFQDWFVRRRCQPEVTGIRIAGLEAARPSAAVRAALAAADLVVLGPSNPYLSIEPILGLPGFRALLAGVTAPRIAVSPVVGGEALKGPAAVMLRRLAGGSRASDVARLYRGLVDGFVLDHRDAGEAEAIRGLGMAVEVTDIVIPDAERRQALAAAVLDFATRLVAESQGKG